MNPLFDRNVYEARRERLVDSVKSGVILFLGNNESPMNYPSNCYKFRQDSNFIYYFGLTLPNMAAMIDVDNQRTILFGDDYEIDDIIWVGEQPAVKDLAARVGVNETMPMSKLGDLLNAANGRRIHFTNPYRFDNQILLSKLMHKPIEELKSMVSLELTQAIVAQRSIKEEVEIAEMQTACDLAFAMHTSVMKACRPGISEQSLVGLAEGSALSKGNGTSFPIILTQHGEIFHNTDHNVDLEAGKLLLMDAGVEGAMHYCSDYTRTYPVTGKFTTQQREIYELVYAGNMLGISMVKKGTAYRDVHFAVAAQMAEGMKSLGLMKGDIAEAVRLGAHALFFPHGLGHMIGLDVHDMEGLGEDNVGYDATYKRSDIFGTRNLRMARELQPGMVVTVEPGLYFIPQLIAMWRKENRFAEFINYDKLDAYLQFGGIRVEDCVLVTDDEPVVLGKAIPKTVEELENIVGMNK